MAAWWDKIVETSENIIVGISIPVGPQMPRHLSEFVSTLYQDVKEGEPLNVHIIISRAMWTPTKYNGESFNHLDTKYYDAEDNLSVYTISACLRALNNNKTRSKL